MEEDDFSGGKDASGGSFGSVGDWTVGIGIAGLGIAAYGQMQQSKAQQQVYQSDIATAGLEQQVNSQRQLQMSLTARRQSIQALRDTQQKMAMGQAAAVQAGALFGSGYKGGQSQIASEGAYNQENISQNLQIGNQIFSLDNQIDQQKIQKAMAESSANKAGGIASLGGDIMKGAGSIAQLASLALVL